MRMLHMLEGRWGALPGDEVAKGVSTENVDRGRWKHAQTGSKERRGWTGGVSTANTGEGG